MAGEGVPMEEITVSSLPVFDEIPAGWCVVRGALTVPCGYELISNGKSRFSRQYQNGVVKCKSTLQRSSANISAISSDKPVTSSALPKDKNSLESVSPMNQKCRKSLIDLLEKK